VRNWGILVTASYAVVVLCLIVPGTLRIGFPADVTLSVSEVYAEPLFWVWAAILVGCQAMLLSLSVDSSARRFRPRQHVLLSVATIAISIALLTGAAVYSVLAGIFGDKDVIWDLLASNRARLVALVLALWAFWGVIFYLYAKARPVAITRLVGWLLTGSVLELLIAVPCHVVVRRRGDCSAPFITAYGIATGLAVMLLSFGPSVLFLYKRRLEQYKKPIVDGASADGMDGELRKGG
jgi:hypothetical protein